MAEQKKHITQETSILTAEDVSKINEIAAKPKKEKKGLFSFFKKKNKK